MSLSGFSPTWGAIALTKTCGSDPKSSSSVEVRRPVCPHSESPRIHRPGLCLQRHIVVPDKFRETARSKGFDNDALRQKLDGSGATAVIPPKVDRVRQIAYDLAMYRWRHL